MPSPSLLPAGRRPTLGGALLLAGSLADAVAAVTGGHHAAEAARRAWPPFVLVAGLLLVGMVAHADGLFDAAADRVARLPGGDSVLLVALLGVVAATTAVLNLDTSVAFLTPILVLTARRRGAAEGPFLYGAVFMSNSASLLLPGSNLTNLLVTAGDRPAGSTFARHMGPAFLASVAVTIVVLLVYQRLSGEPATRPAPLPRRTAGGGLALAALATVAAAVLVVGVDEPALPVLAVGAAAVAIRLIQRRVTPAALVDAVGPAALAGLYGLTVALGALARAWDGPARLLGSSGRAATAALGAVAAVLTNNLPAAVLLSARPPRHPDALLVGLNLGPNLAVTGSLSALLWWQAARRVSARPSAATYSRLGIVLVPLSVAAGLAMLALGAGAL